MYLKNIKSFIEFNQKINESVDIRYNGYDFKYINSSDVSEFKEALDFLNDRFKTYISYHEPSIYITYHINGGLVAVCEFEIVDINKMHISYIYSDVKRKGIASSMIKTLISSYPNYKITAYVRKSNIPSLTMFKELGFKIIGETQVDDLDEISFILEYDE